MSKIARHANKKRPGSASFAVHFVISNELRLHTLHHSEEPPGRVSFEENTQAAL